MITFQNPAAFFALLLIPLLIILRLTKIFSRISFKAVFADWKGQSFVWKGHIQKALSILAKILLAAGFLLTVTAMADPVKTSQEKVFKSIGTDIIFVLDSSPSMAAKDMGTGTRLDAAKQAIYSLSSKNENFRLGLVGLGSTAQVIVPPTNDMGFFLSRVADLKVGGLGDGSAIGDGLSTAICHLAASSTPKKCVILLTDGENNAGEINPETAAKLAASNGISTYIVGIGTKGTVPLEYTDPATGKVYSGYLDSNFNSESLRKVSAAGGGKYFEVADLDSLSQTLTQVAKSESLSQDFTYKSINKSYYQKILTIAIILFIISWIIKRIILKELVCFRYKKSLIVRSIFLTLAFAMIVLARSGLSWGTQLVPVQKSTSSVAMVFDISYSMMAKDGPGKTERIKAAAIYAKGLLEKMQGTACSVTLAKGDGVTAIPLTEDYADIESLLDVLSPALMTTPGTSLGKGIAKARLSFPENYSSAGRIWVFTDCEETDRELTPALEDCIRRGIPVTFIGFGSEKGSTVLAGDGKTEVTTALRSQEIINTIDETNHKFSIYKTNAKAAYIKSFDKGSAALLLSQLKVSPKMNQVTTYEIKSLPRFKFFLLLTIVFFALSFFITEFNFKKFFGKMTFSTAALVFTLTFSMIFTACSSKTADILEGAFFWQQKQYKHSISKFLQTAQKAHEEGDIQTENYARYNLGTTYFMLGEDQAALDQFRQISPDAPDNLRFCAFYNSGLIEHKSGNYKEARENFKQALKIDNSQTDAKINFELSLETKEESAKEKESQAVQGSEEKSQDSSLEQAIFQRIRENDQKKWKNTERPQTQNLAEDY